MPTPTPAQLLRGAGLRCTQARLAVLAALQSLGAPATHAQLGACPELRDTDPVTLYRALSALEQVGLTHRVQGIDGIWRTCPQPHGRRGCPGNHAHFLCQRCGSMECLPDQPLPRVLVPAGVEVAGRQLIAYGSCRTCSSPAHPKVGR